MVSSQDQDGLTRLGNRHTIVIPLHRVIQTCRSVFQSKGGIKHTVLTLDNVIPARHLTTILICSIHNLPLLYTALLGWQRSDGSKEGLPEAEQITDVHFCPGAGCPCVH